MIPHGKGDSGLALRRFPHLVSPEAEQVEHILPGVAPRGAVLADKLYVVGAVRFVHAKGDKHIVAVAVGEAVAGAGIVIGHHRQGYAGGHIYRRARRAPQSGDAYIGRSGFHRTVLQLCEIPGRVGGALPPHRHLVERGLVAPALEAHRDRGVRRQHRPGVRNGLDVGRDLAVIHPDVKQAVVVENLQAGALRRIGRLGQRGVSTQVEYVALRGPRGGAAADKLQRVGRGHPGLIVLFHHGQGHEHVAALPVLEHEAGAGVVVVPIGQQDVRRGIQPGGRGNGQRRGGVIIRGRAQRRAFPLQAGQIPVAAHRTRRADKQPGKGRAVLPGFEARGNFGVISENIGLLIGRTHLARHPLVVQPDGELAVRVEHRERNPAGRVGLGDDVPVAGNIGDEAFAAPVVAVPADELESIGILVLLIVHGQRNEHVVALFIHKPEAGAGVFPLLTGQGHASVDIHRALGGGVQGHPVEVAGIQAPDRARRLSR